MNLSSPHIVLAFFAPFLELFCFTLGNIVVVASVGVSNSCPFCPLDHRVTQQNTKQSRQAEFRQVPFISIVTPASFYIILIQNCVYSWNGNADRRHRINRKCCIYPEYMDMLMHSVQENNTVSCLHIHPTLDLHVPSLPHHKSSTHHGHMWITPSAQLWIPNHHICNSLNTFILVQTGSRWCRDT